MRSAKARSTTSLFPRYRTMRVSDAAFPANVLLINT
jgi:hypothetical protein